MASLTILIRHAGKWNDENCYIEYSIDGIVLKEYTSYSDLVELISGQLNIDLTTTCITIKYNVKGNDTPVKLWNDMGVRVYVQSNPSDNDIWKSKTSGNEMHYSL